MLALLYCCLVDGSIPAIKLATYRRRLNLGLEVGNCHRAMFNFFYSCVRSWMLFMFFFFWSFSWFLNWKGFLYAVGYPRWNKFTKSMLTSEKHGIRVLMHDQRSKRYWISTWDPLLRQVILAEFGWLFFFFASTLLKVILEVWTVIYLLSFQMQHWGSWSTVCIVKLRIIVCK